MCHMIQQSHAEVFTTDGGGGEIHPFKGLLMNASSSFYTTAKTWKQANVDQLG